MSRAEGRRGGRVVTMLFLAAYRDQVWYVPRIAGTCDTKDGPAGNTDRADQRCVGRAEWQGHGQDDPSRQTICSPASLHPSKRWWLHEEERP